MRNLRKHLFAYAVALVATALAVALRGLLDPWLGPFLPFPTLYGAVAVAVWFAGYRAALLSTIVGFLACDYFFVDPRRTLGITSSQDYIGFGLVLLSCLIIIGFGHALRIARYKAELGRRQLRERTDALSLAMRAGRMGAWSRNLETQTVWWSRELEQLYGFEPGEFERTEKGYLAFVHDEDRDAVEQAVERALRTHQDYVVEFRFRHRSGEWRWMEGRGEAAYDASGTPTMLYGLGIDITERRRLQMRERAARAEAEEASRLKDEFLATVSHELRTPLSAILGWARLLREGRLDDEKAFHAAEVVERNARAQAQLIDDLLDVSRIITGKLRLNVMSVMPAAVVESALDSVRPMAAAKGIHLVPILDPEAGPISADAERLQQVVWNLLSNAVKFTPRGGLVEVRVERRESQLEITVRDTGQGISAEFLPYVFDRFRQADPSSARAVTGLGLGLSIVRHLVELHGGMVRVESAGIGRGATFTVALPIPALRMAGPEGRLSPVDRASMEAMDVTMSLGGARVLIVDDEPDARDLVTELLQRLGADVKAVDSARHALDELREWRPQAIVSDIAMPGEDGYALIRGVRRWEEESGGWIPTIALTAYARNEDRARSLAAGYLAHLAKPVDAIELAEVVASAIQLAPRDTKEPARHA
ncbi:MAG TPA: ATP-binding protein [Candidatus Udaeobacter sp.]|jgi:PAS domain S-box-containing protein|nr:ATP-binding protein [Candidatus Udaeobacter sp.]